MSFFLLFTVNLCLKKQDITLFLFSCNGVVVISSLPRRRRRLRPIAVGIASRVNVLIVQVVAVNQRRFAHFNHGHDAVFLLG